MDDEKAEKIPLPPKVEGLTTFQKLCVIRAMRPDRITDALADWCTDILGTRYVEEPPFNMGEVFLETSAASPVFFVLFPGVNPYGFVEDLGKDVGYTEDAEEGKILRRVSMGQGQEPIAEKLLEDFGKTGGWVFLDNIHLMQSWLPKLERALEIQAETAHDDFRVFLTAEPHAFPLTRCHTHGHNRTATPMLQHMLTFHGPSATSQSPNITLLCILTLTCSDLIHSF